MSMGSPTIWKSSKLCSYMIAGVNVDPTRLSELNWLECAHIPRTRSERVGRFFTSKVKMKLNPAKRLKRAHLKSQGGKSWLECGELCNLLLCGTLV